MKLSLTTSGLLDPKRLDSWVPEKRRAIRKAVEAGMKTAGKEIADTVRTRMQSAFTVRKAAFLKSMRHKLYAGSPEKFPALLIGSRIRPSITRRNALRPIRWCSGRSGISSRPPMVPP